MNDFNGDKTVKEEFIPQKPQLNRNSGNTLEVCQGKFHFAKDVHVVMSDFEEGNSRL